MFEPYEPPAPLTAHDILAARALVARCRAALSPWPLRFMSLIDASDSGARLAAALDETPPSPAEVRSLMWRCAADLQILAGFPATPRSF